MYKRIWYVIWYLATTISQNFMALCYFLNSRIFFRKLFFYVLVCILSCVGIIHLRFLPITTECRFDVFSTKLEVINKVYISWFIYKMVHAKIVKQEYTLSRGRPITKYSLFLFFAAKVRERWSQINDATRVIFQTDVPNMHTSKFLLNLLIKSPCEASLDAVLLLNQLKFCFGENQFHATVLKPT